MRRSMGPANNKRKPVRPALARRERTKRLKKLKYDVFSWAGDVISREVKYA